METRADVERVVMSGVATVVAAGGLLTGLALRGGGGEGSHGAGFNYRDEFYGMSGAEIRADRLGPALDRDMPIMDSRTDVREIFGIDAGIAVAAYLCVVGGTPAENGAAWLLMSPDGTWRLILGRTPACRTPSTTGGDGPDLRSASVSGRRNARHSSSPTQQLREESAAERRGHRPEGLPVDVALEHAARGAVSGTVSTAPRRRRRRNLRPP